MHNQPIKTDQTSSKIWKALASLLSYLFHPVFVPVYFILFLLYVHPIHFLGYTSQERLLILLQAISMFSFFPLVTVGLLKALGFISSIQLREQKDRIIPLVASGIWYFWIWYVWKNMPGHPAVAVQYALGIWLSSVAALLLNTRFKISLHTLGLGVTLCLLLQMAVLENLYYGMWISVALLITGLVSSARLYLNSHRPGEVYWGLLVGALSVFIAGVFV
ncbi:MAG: hypothetical protein FJY19_06675 [Bacteroidetes bacterium]|nr:hypothetical protein [Bacteroidota bacterium]